ncbi:MAG TPA: hypothetical protein VG106_08185, partial [Vicinamibacterales bacterium]|nr:hypothetical protein [Vicinamibacterales bacterium]
MAPWVLLALAVLSASAGNSGQAAQQDPLLTLVADIEKAAIAGDPAAFNVLVAPEAARSGVADFAALLAPRPTRAVVKERDRLETGDGRGRILIELLMERGIEGEISTWRVDVTSTGGGWRIAGMERLAVVSGLYRLSLNPAKQFTVKNLRLTGIDVRVEMPSGSAFVAETPE